MNGDMTDSSYNTIKPAQSLPVLSKVPIARDKKERDASPYDNKQSGREPGEMQEKPADTVTDADSENHLPQNDTEQHCIDFCA